MYRAPILLVASLALGGVGCGSDTDLPSVTMDTAAPGIVAVPDTVMDRLRIGDPARVIVQIDRAALSRFDAALPLGIDLERAFVHLPVRVLRLASVDAALRLLGMPDVVSIEPEILFDPTINDGLAHIRQPAAAAHGYTGAGTSVAVLDTGVDWTHADLGSCTSVGAPDACRVVFSADFGEDDGKLDDNVRHGTNVAATVAAVAPGADILGLDVFGRGGQASSIDILAAFDWVIANQATYNIAAMNLSLGHSGFTTPCTGTAFDSAILAARDAGVSVVAAAGNDGFTNGISSPACVPGAFSVGAVHDATNVGAYCAGGSIEADDVACFSNSASFLDILAPGYDITAGGVTMSGTSMATPHVAGAIAVLRAADPDASVATLEDRLLDEGPLVTDARNGLTFPRLDLLAAVDSERCTVDVDPGSIAPDPARDAGTFVLTADPGCAWTAVSSGPWLAVSPASGTGGGQVSWTAAANPGLPRNATVDFGTSVVSAAQASGSGQEGQIIINGGADATRDTTVTLALNAPGAAFVCLSNAEGPCTRFKSFEISQRWRVQGGAGLRTVTAWFADAEGNVGEPTQDTILLDRGKPVDGIVVPEAQSGVVTLRWEGFADELTAIASYRVVQSTGRRAPRGSCGETPIWTGTDTAISVHGLTDGVVHHWRVCAIDEAGNVSKGATASLEVRPEYDGPVGSIVLDGGAEYTRSRTVVASLSATDAGQVTEACVTTKDTCSSWSEMADQVSISLRSSPDPQPVHAWFRDEHGNQSGPFSDTITVDGTAPIDGGLVATPDDGAVTLVLHDFHDRGAGIAGYVVHLVEDDREPRRCDGEPISYGSSTTIRLDGLVNGTAYGVRVCAIDAVGNRSRGVGTVFSPVPERDPPSGSVVIEDGAEGTASRKVSLTLSASDPSGVARMCVSATDACRRWTSYATGAQVNLAQGEGTRTVSVWFEDSWGNRSAAVTDTIEIDTVPPADGTAQWAGNTLSWSGFSDAGSGLASYLVRAKGGRPPTCTNGAVVYEGSATSVDLPGGGGVDVYFRVCAIDAYGNTSSGATAGAGG